MKESRVKVLHLVDDEKFTDCIIRTFDYFADMAESDYIILRDTTSLDLKWILAEGRIKSISRNSPSWLDLINSSSYDIIWIHALTEIKAYFVNQLKTGARPYVVWSTFGYDYLYLLELPLHGLRSGLKDFIYKPFRKRISWLGRRVLSFLYLDSAFWPKWFKHFRGKVNFYTCVLEEEWPNMERVLGTSASPLKFHYMDDISGKGNDIAETCVLDSKRIWVGNSATSTNNFYDVLPLLRKRCVGWQIIVPLSYGSMDLASRINKLGMRLFAENWHPMTGFVPSDVYKKRMAACSVFIFGHRRQQALGNISIALLQGGCVFLDDKSPAFHHFINNGIVVYPIRALKSKFDEYLAEFKDLREQNMQRMKKLRDVYRNEVIETVEHVIAMVKQEETTMEALERDGHK